MLELLFEDDNSNVRAHFSTECAADAFILGGYLRRGITLMIELFTQQYQLVWTGYGAESTPLTSQLIYRNHCHVLRSLVCTTVCQVSL
jgi:hypothetical protein